MLALMRATGSGAAGKSGESSMQKNVRTCNGERDTSGLQSKASVHFEIFCWLYGEHVFHCSFLLSKYLFSYFVCPANGFLNTDT